MLAIDQGDLADLAGSLYWGVGSQEWILDGATPPSGFRHPLTSTGMFITMYIVLSILPPAEDRRMAGPSRRPLPVWH